MHVAAVFVCGDGGVADFVGIGEEILAIGGIFDFGDLVVDIGFRVGATCIQVDYRFSLCFNKSAAVWGVGSSSDIGIKGTLVLLWVAVLVGSVADLKYIC